MGFRPKSARAAQMQMAMVGKTASTPLMTIHVFGLIQMAMGMLIKQEQISLMTVQTSLVHRLTMYVDVSTRMATVGLMNQINTQMMHPSILHQKIPVATQLFC